MLKVLRIGGKLMKSLIEEIRKNPKGYLKANASIFGEDLDNHSDESLLCLLYATATFDSAHYFRRLDQALMSRLHLLDDPLKAFYYHKFKGLFSRSLLQGADALMHFTAAYDQAILINDDELISRILSFIATAFDQMGDRDSAIEYAQRAIQMVPLVKSKSLIAELYMNYATILKHAGNIEACLTAYQYAEMAYNEVQNSEEYLNHCILLINIGGIFLNQSMEKLGENYLTRALSMAEKHDFMPYLQGSIKIISEYYSKVGAIEKANAVLKLYLESHLNSSQNSDLKAMRLKDENTLSRLNTLHHLQRTNQQLSHELKQLKQIMASEDERLIKSGLKLSEISEGIRLGEFSPFLQAKWSIQTGEITGAEILARWVKPSGEIIEPGAFIGLIENNDLIFAFSEQLIRKALSALSPFIRNEMPTFKLAINVSPYQLAHQDIAGLLETCCVEYRILPLNIEVEIIERTFIENDPHAIEQLFILKEKGFSIALDDFGSGYSSLACIVALPLDVVKIDKSLVDGLATSPKSKRLFTSLVGMLSELNIATIAEGIETKTQLEVIQSTSCLEGQGYLVHKPISADQFTVKVDSPS